MRFMAAMIAACVSAMLGATLGGQEAQATGCEAKDDTFKGDVLGVSRVIEVDAKGGPRIGTYQYPSTLDLAPGEVVLTFDDGPHRKNTTRILKALEAECVQATFFPIGQWAVREMKTLREMARRGHTIGSHSWSHPANLARLPALEARAEIERGFIAVSAALGRPAAPFLRLPGLNDSTALRAYATARDYAVISCDIGTDDWRGISAARIVARTMKRLERKGSGILLFHDRRANTAKAIPLLLRELKSRGYRIVHMVAKPPPKPRQPGKAPKLALALGWTLSDGVQYRRPSKGAVFRPVQPLAR